VIEIFKEGTYGPVRVGEGYTARFLAYHIVAHGGPAPKILGFVPSTHNDLWDATCDMLSSGSEIPLFGY
tara:strand:- start:2865 stop:3071 length:207 start_codon:yes stop_codon:yes gene_type:complete